MYVHVYSRQMRTFKPLFISQSYLDSECASSEFWCLAYGLQKYIWCFAVVNQVPRMFDAKNVYRRVTGLMHALAKENMSQKNHGQRRWARDFDFRKKNNGWDRCKLLFLLLLYYFYVCLL